MGLAYACLWRLVTVELAHFCFPHIRHWRISHFLRLKDTWRMGPDVLMWEREQTLHAVHSWESEQGMKRRKQCD